MGPDGPLRFVDNIGGAWDGAQLTIHLKNLFFATFLLSNLPSGCGPWRKQHGFLAVSCLALVSGQQYDCGDHCEQESNIQFLTKQALLASTPPGAVRRLTWAWLLTIGPASCRLQPLSCAVCPILSFRHIEDVCNFSRRLGLESLNDQHLGFWFDLGHVDRSNVEH